MQPAEFVRAVTCKVAAHLAQEMQAAHVAHNFTNNLLEQLNVIHNKNPHLDILQVMAMMYAEDPKSNIFAEAFNELQGPGKQILGINIQYIPQVHAPKVMSIVIGKAM